MCARRDSTLAISRDSSLVPVPSLLLRMNARPVERSPISQ